MNTQPDPDELDPAALARPSIYSGRGRAAPLGTFVPGTGGAAHQVGLQHGAGRRAAQQLRDAGVTFPAGARLVQDHPRRGLVVEIPLGTAAVAVAELLVQMASQLTVVPLGERWVVEIY